MLLGTSREVPFRLCVVLHVGLCGDSLLWRGKCLDQGIVLDNGPTYELAEELT